MTTVAIISMFAIMAVIFSLNNKIEEDIREFTVSETPVLISDDKKRSERPKEDMLESKVITTEEQPPISPYGPGEEYYYEVTEEERLALMKVVYEEARGEPFEGKVAVAAVVLNRWTSNDPQFDTTSVITVLTQKNQFADISETTIEELQTVPECELAVDEALRGYDPTRAEFENGAMYFYAPDEVKGYQVEIRQNINVYPIGNHNFHESF